MGFVLPNVPLPDQGSGLHRRSINFYFADLYIQVWILTRGLNDCPSFNASVQVEGTLFKVNQRDFEQGSEIFKTMFYLPRGEIFPEGGCPEIPLVLKDVSTGDMEHFLAEVYPP